MSDAALQSVILATTSLPQAWFLLCRFDMASNGRCTLQLSVDQQKMMVLDTVLQSVSSDSLSHLTLGTSAGVPSFSGCLYDLIIDQREVSTVDDAVSGYSIGECCLNSLYFSLQWNNRADSVLTPNYELVASMTDSDLGFQSFGCRIGLHLKFYPVPSDSFCILTISYDIL